MEDTKLTKLTIDNLREIVADILDVEPSRISLESGPGVTDNWDSLAHLSIMTATEEAYGVKFDMTEIQRIDSFAALFKALSERQTA